jgi:hypothetical protein
MYLMYSFKGLVLGVLRLKTREMRDWKRGGEREMGSGRVGDEEIGRMNRIIEPSNFEPF